MKKRHYDIRAYKHNLRDRYKGIRRAMTAENRNTCDARIRGRVLHLPEYQKCRTLLCFISMPELEVDTRRLLKQALLDGKTVAVPYCVKGTRIMHFYEISSFNDVSPGTFDVLEPDPEKAKKVVDFSQSICILPGLSFDRNGYRLGYGGGYYDRFLSKAYQGQGGAKIGVCYSNCVTHQLPRGRFDVPCDILITEKYVRRIGQKNRAGHASRRKRSTKRKKR